MTNLEMLEEMAELQAKYDEAVYSTHNCKFDKDKCYCALVDEIGELNHELKANWCWWKKTQKPVDNDKVLEELVDVWHFALSLYNHDNRYDYIKFNTAFDSVELDISYCYALAGPLYNRESLIGDMINLTYCLDFKFKEVYEAYKAKNKINYERLENGY